MAKLHLIPRGSVFENQLRKLCDPEDEVVDYDRTIRGYFSLFQKIRRSDAMFIFHFVPHRFIWISRFFIKFDFTLHFWGSDFYSFILSEQTLESRPIVNRYLPMGKILKTANRRSPFKCIKSYIDKRIAVNNLCHATNISGLNKYLKRYCQYLIRRRITTKKPQFVNIYTYKHNSIIKKVKEKTLNDDICFVITHSATLNTYPNLTMQLLEEYCFRWKTNVKAIAFMSYSGTIQERKERIALLKSMQKNVDLQVIEEFLNETDLVQVLSEADIFISHAIRGEGMSMCEQLCDMGGKAFFPRFSNNYLFLKEKGYVDIHALDMILQMSPEKLRT